MVMRACDDVFLIHVLFHPVMVCGHGAVKYLEAQLDSVNPGLKHVVSKSVVTIHLPDEFSIRVKTCDDPTASPLTRR